MRVVEIETQEHKVRYVVMDEEGKLVGPIVQYLKYLDRIGSARNTLRSYAAAQGRETAPPKDRYARSSANAPRRLYESA